MMQVNDVRHANCRNSKDARNLKRLANVLANRECDEKVNPRIMLDLTDMMRNALDDVNRCTPIGSDVIIGDKVYISSRDARTVYDALAWYFEVFDDALVMYHHDACARGYARVSDGRRFEAYSGRFGEGCKVHLPSRRCYPIGRRSNSHHTIEYYIYA